MSIAEPCYSPALSAAFAGRGKPALRRLQDEGAEAEWARRLRGAFAMAESPGERLTREMAQGSERPDQDRAPWFFPRWQEARNGALLSAGARREFTLEILGFLRHCKVSHAPVTVILAKEYLAE